MGFNFRGGLIITIFAEVHTHAHYVRYNQAYFVGLIFTVRQSSVKTQIFDPSKISHYTVIIFHIGVPSLTGIAH